MICKGAESLVTPYIHKELSEREMEESLEHIETCEGCKEELEVYYTVDMGIRQLDMDTGAYSIREAMEENITTSEQRLYTLRVFDICRCTFSTLTVICMLVILVLRIYIWWQMGVS